MTVTLVMRAADAPAPAAPAPVVPDLDAMRDRLRALTDIDVDSLRPAILPLAYETAELFHALDAERWQRWCEWKPSNRSR